MDTRRIGVPEFTDYFNTTATATSGSQVPVLERQIRRWKAGQQYPTSANRDVIARMLGIATTAVGELFSPPAPSNEYVLAMVVWPPRDHLPTDPVMSYSSVQDHIDRAAAESEHFATTIDRGATDPEIVTVLDSRIRDIVHRYPNSPVFPLFIELRTLRNHVFALLDTRPTPGHRRELQLLAGLACAVMSNACFDLGNIRAAEIEARTALRCAELAGHNGLRSWIRGTQALVAYWDGRAAEAITLCRDGYGHRPETGTSHVRLAALEARALARTKDSRGATQALLRVDRAREKATTVDDPGGMMAFPLAKQLGTTAAAQLWLGTPAHIATAETLAREAIDLHLSAPAQTRRHGELQLARVDLATALLHRHQLEGAAEVIEAVLDELRRRRIESVALRLRQLASLLNRPHYQTAAHAIDLHARITATLAS